MEWLLAMQWVFDFTLNNGSVIACWPVLMLEIKPEIKVKLALGTSNQQQEQKS